MGNRAVDGLKSSTDADLLALAEVEEGRARDPAVNLKLKELIEDA